MGMGLGRTVLGFALIAGFVLAAAGPASASAPAPAPAQRLAYWGCQAHCDSHAGCSVTGCVPSQAIYGYLMFDPTSGATQPLPLEGDYPSWSADGRKVAFASSGGEIYTMNADGSRLRRLTWKSQPDWFAIRPSWSPDGKQIVFQSGGIWKINADGSGLKLLYAAAEWPAWSPDGTKIAFVDARNGEQGLYVMNPDGSGLSLLIDLRTGSSGLRGIENPDWSPDGRQLAFDAMPGTVGFLPYHLYKINADGSGLTALTNTQPARYEFNPLWSPDGQTIAFATVSDGTHTIAPDGSGAIKLPLRTSPDSNYNRPVGWQPCPSGCPGAGTVRARVQAVQASLSALPVTSKGGRQWRANTLETLALVVQPERWRADGTLALTEAGLTGMRLLRLAAGRLSWANPELHTASVAERDELVDLMNVVARVRFLEVSKALSFGELADPGLVFLLWRAERRIDTGDSEPTRIQATLEYLDSWRMLLNQPAL